MNKRVDNQADAVGTDTAAALKWRPSAIAKMGVVAIATGVTGPFDLAWGDGTITQGTANVPVSHTYTNARAYTATVRQEGTIIAQAQVVVRDSLTPTVTFTAQASNPNFIDATFNDEPADVVSKYRILWEPGQSEELFAPKGTKKTHGYPAGDHDVLVQDLFTGRVLRETITVKDKEYDPDFKVEKGSDTSTALLTLTRVLATPAKNVVIDWGDGDQTTIDAAAVDKTASHKYIDPDNYIIQCVYADGSTEGSARVVTIPFPA
jgi:hypothetical protein